MEERRATLWLVMHPSEVVLAALAIPLGATSAMDERWRKPMCGEIKRKECLKSIESVKAYRDAEKGEVCDRLSLGLVNLPS